VGSLGTAGTGGAAERSGTAPLLAMRTLGWLCAIGV